MKKDRKFHLLFSIILMFCLPEIFSYMSVLLGGKPSNPPLTLYIFIATLLLLVFGIYFGIKKNEENPKMFVKWLCISLTILFVSSLGSTVIIKTTIINGLLLIFMTFILCFLTIFFWDLHFQLKKKTLNEILRKL